MPPTLLTWAAPNASPRAGVVAAQDYVPELDGLRAIAILIVFASHYFTPGIPGGFGVTVFFFISGYLITTLLLREFQATGSIDLRSFYIRRFLRLGPALYCYLAVVVIWVAIQKGVIEPRAMAAAALYVFNYFEAIEGPSAYPMPLWSLAVEEHFYLLFPGVLLGVLVATRRHLLLAAAALITLPLAFRVIGSTCFAISSQYIYVATEMRIDSIMYGVVLALLLVNARTADACRRFASVPGMAVGVCLVLASLVVRDELFRQTLRYSVQGGGLLLIVNAILHGQHAQWLRRILSLQHLRYIGKISYSLYLWHLTVLVLLGEMVERRALIPAAAALSLLLAAGSYHWVERPMLRLRHKFGSHAR
ncbi:acyltransferase [Ramlibacter ginsenosidimutans]|uniref:Acyltransferase n=1 Tax=Ramlibacter ginsenosidimutans TaxID=502333 RepID=A0A934WL20_9BURK|nr:acyltransferase [Ramlibacter ginsenosidimutans]MBK6005165.1 acyltransferase [Ramlibacter ginsenosidimutans]